MADRLWPTPCGGRGRLLCGQSLVAASSRLRWMLEAGTQRMALDMMPGSALREVPETDIAYGLRNQVVICLLGFG